ncbi:hypothetical protein CR513_04135, partial [Mucuna pruriens]
MHPLDKKTTFMIKTTNYYCKVIPFGSKNADAIIQRLNDRILTISNHCVHLKELFKTINYNLKLNVEKYLFGSKFLGFIFIHMGIKINLDKDLIIFNMKSLLVIENFLSSNARRKMINSLDWKNVP